MQNVTYDDKSDLTSQELHQRVLRTISFIAKRGQKTFNGKLNDEEIEKFCVLDEEAQSTLKGAIERFALSFRSIKKLQKVALTIADLEQSEMIRKKDILEALSYRRR